MAFNEKITLMVDVVTGNARSGLGRIKSDLANTEGAFNKFKVAGRGAFDMVGVMGPQIALAAGGALVAFGVKSVKAFTDTALAADKFRDATGLGIEESSKWVAVADDVGVSAETIQGAFIKMEKAISTNREAFGDLVVTAKDGSVDLSATFLNVITHLQGIQDPIERANEAAKLFGRGFAEVSQLITTDAGLLKDALAGVSEEQVIDEAEVEKARDMQAAMDALKDSVEDVGRALGEFLVPTLSDLGELASTGIDIVVNLKEGTGGEKSPIFQNLKEFVGSFWEGITTGKPPWEIWAKEISGTAAALGAAKAGVDGVGGSLRAGKVDAGGWGESIGFAAESAGDAIDDVSVAYQLLKDELTIEEGALNLDDMFADVEQAAKDAWEAVSTGAVDADEKVRNHQSEVNSLKKRVLEYGESVIGLPAEKATAILALIDQGKLTEADEALDEAAKARQAALDAKARHVPEAEKAFNNAARTRVAAMNAQAHKDGAESALNHTARTRTATINAIVNAGGASGQLSELARDRFATINVSTRVTGGVGASSIPAGAAGFNDFPGGIAIVGEDGPELVNLPRGTDVMPAKQTQAFIGGPSALGGVGSGGQVVIHFHGPVLGTKAEFGRFVQEAVAEASRRGFRVA